MAFATALAACDGGVTGANLDATVATDTTSGMDVALIDAPTQRPDLTLADVVRTDVPRDARPDVRDVGPIDAAVCGDGYKIRSEECDDGNNLDNDGCSAVCLLEGDCTRPIDFDARAVADSSGRVSMTYLSGVARGNLGRQSCAFSEIDEFVVRYTPTVSGRVLIETSAVAPGARDAGLDSIEVDTVLSAHEMCADPALPDGGFPRDAGIPNELACNDNARGGVRSSALDVAVVAGTPIFVRVGVRLATGPMDPFRVPILLRVSPLTIIENGAPCNPASDRCNRGYECLQGLGDASSVFLCEDVSTTACPAERAAPVMIDLSTTDVERNATLGSRRLPLGSCTGAAFVSDVYAVRAPQRGRFSADVFSDSDDTVLSLRARCLDTSTEVSCSAFPTRDVAAGEILYVVVQGPPGDDYELTLSFTATSGDGEPCITGFFSPLSCATGLLCRVPLTVDAGTMGVCRPPRCGDGYVDVSLDEECDDGNTNETDACVSCRLHTVRFADTCATPIVVTSGTMTAANTWTFLGRTVDLPEGDAGAPDIGPDAGSNLSRVSYTGGTCGAGEGADRVFLFTAPSAGRIDVSTVAPETAFGVSVRINSGCLGRSVSCAGSDFSAGGVIRNFLVDAGENVYIWVDSASLTSRIFRLTVAFTPST